MGSVKCTEPHVKYANFYIIEVVGGFLDGSNLAKVVTIELSHYK